jgi:hypothetical protein
VKEKIALGFAAILTAISLYLVPSWQGALTDPCRLAGIFSAATIALLVVTRHLGRRGILIERRVLALFLAGMPLIYVASWLATRGAGGPGGWLWVEIAGVPLYTALAILGLTRSPWFLAAGIAAHGVAWDSWHYFTHTGYIPSWYAIGCFLVDVGLGLYIATRIPAWQRADAPALAKTLKIA